MSKRGKAQAALMLSDYTFNKSAPAGTGVTCPSCSKAFVKRDAKEVFCSNTGPGNCKNHYWTVMRSSAGKVLLDKLDAVADTAPEAPAAVALFMAEPEVEAFLLKLHHVLGKNDGVDVHCRVNADEIRLFVVLSDEWGLYTHECPLLFETDSLAVVQDLVEVVFTQLQVFLNEK